MAERVVTTPVRGTSVAPSVAEVAVTTPIDRVRWTSVFAGFFTVLSTIVVLTVLGIAIGLSTVDANNPRGFALGLSIYGGIVALIAFFLGGMISARTAAVGGSRNGILNGAMVWIITIPILVYVLGNGIGSMLGTAADLTTKAATIGAAAAGPAIGEVAGQVAANPTLAATVQAGVNGTTGTTGTSAEATAAASSGVAGQAQAAVATAQNQIQQVTPEQIENTAQDASNVAWATLLALGLSAGAAIIGGLAGGRSYGGDVAVTRRT